MFTDWRANIVKLQISPKMIYRFHKITIKIPGVFVEIDRLILKLIWKCKRPRTGKAILQKNKIGELTLTRFQNYKTTIIKTACYWYKDKSVGHFNK